MNPLWRSVLGIALGLATTWLALAIFLFLARPKETSLGEVLRLIPDTIILLKRLALDRSLSRGIRIRLWLLLLYLASPIDLIPDFIPVIGYADDAIIICFILRSVIRKAGPESIRAHWPGTSQGLAALWRAARLPGVAPG